MSPRRALLLVLPLIACVLLLAVADPVSAQGGSLDAAVPEVTPFFERALGLAAPRTITATWPLQLDQAGDIEAALAQAGFRVNPSSAPGEATYTISGTVRDWDGAPQTHFWVVASGGDQAYMQEFQSATGEYALRVIAGAYEVGVWEGNWPRPASQRVAVPSDASSVDFIFPQRYTITGTVFDWDGAPLAGASINASYVPGQVQTFFATADATGTYTLTVGAGAFRVSAFKDWLPGPPPRTVSVPPDVSGLDLTLPARYTITGTVRDAVGAPVENASVSIVSAVAYLQTATTDATGAYTLTVGAGTHQVIARASGIPTLGPFSVTVPPNAAGIDFTLPPRQVIRGIVHDWDGSPLQGVSVATTSPDPIAATAVTDATGAYTLTVVAGVHQIKASKAGLPSPAVRAVSVPPDAVGIDFAFPRPYTITGTVFDWDGAPVQWAGVAAFGNGEHTETRVGDPTGAYTLTVSAGSYVVSIYHQGWPGPPDQQVTVPPDKAGVHFTFPRRYTIAGRVTNHDGTPVVGAWVSLYRSGQGVTVASASTDSSGFYAFVVAAGVYEVRFGSISHSVTTPPSVLDVDFVLPPTYTIRGTVRDWDGSPLAGVEVSTSGADITYARANTDAAGAYTLTVTAGRFTISPRIPGVLSQPKQTVIVPPDATGIDFTAPQRHTIRGSVRDFDGAALTEARVAALNSSKEYDVATTRTDAAGAYTLTLVPGAYSIRATQQGLPSPPDQDVTVPPDVTGLDFTFPQRYTISGVVRDWDGTPLAGVDVYTSGSGFYYYTYAKTNWAGVYTLTVQAGVYRLTSYNYLGLPVPEPITVTVPPSVSTANITLPVRYTISGMVRKSDGSPASGALVRTGNLDPFYNSYVTTANGVYILSVKAGAYHVTAALGNLRTAEQTVTVPPAATGVDFVLPEYYRIRGTVRDWDGRPMPFVNVRTADGDPLVTYMNTDGAGRYELQVLPGVYHVSASNYGRPAPPAQTITVPPDAGEVDFVFPRTYTIRGTVRDHEGFPVRNAEVSVGGGTARTESAGTYTLVVTAGRWVVRATKDGVPAQEERRVETPPDATGVDFALPPPPTSYTISGTVRDQYGNPIADATVGGAATTAANGTYTLTLPAGTHYLLPSKAGYKGSHGVIVRTPPAATGVDVILYAQDRVIFGQVMDQAGQPLAGARVNVWNAICSDRGGGYAETGADGAYRIVVAAGIYRVMAYRSGSITPQEQLVDLEGAGVPAEVRVDLTMTSPPYTISGQVRDRAGRPVVRASVAATSCGPINYTTQSDITGAYTVSVGTGTYILDAGDGAAPPAPIQPSGALPFIASPDAIPAEAAAVSAFGTRPGRVSAAPPSVTGVDIVITSAMLRYIVRGRVTDSEGWPLAGAYVNTAWTGAENGQNTRLTDTNGEFTLELWPGTYRVSVLKYGYARPEPRTVIVPPAQSGVNFVLAPAPDNIPYTVMGTVRDALGRPTSQALICVQPTAGVNWQLSPCQQVYYDGTFKLTLEPGAYRLYATGLNGCDAPSETQQITVPPEHGRLTFTIRALDQLVSGLVVDTLAAAGLRRARVGAREDLMDLSRTTDGWGRYYLPLPSGAFTLTAAKDGYGAAADVRVEIPLAVPGVDFMLPLPPNTIQGVVRDPRGAAVAGATVEVNGPVQMEPTATDADGAYRLYVPDGAWQVTVSRPGYTAFPPRKPAGVPPSPAQVDFMLVPNGEVRWRYLPLLLQMPAQQ